METMTINGMAKHAEELRKDFPAGTRVRLVQMDDPYTKIPVGTLGTVSVVDDMATIHVNWDSGSTLGVVFGVDKVDKLG